MKKILLVATGGTIASVAEEGGLTPGLTGGELAAFVPRLSQLCAFDVVQPMNIDSTNMRPGGWLAIAGEIERAWDCYDGFVVMHGTDTLAYTAAGLSYLIQGGDKPVVLTGSQLPMADPITDATANLCQSFLYALDEGSRGVSVVFGGKVIAGTRARKCRTLSFDAFESVNYPLLATIRGERILRTPGFDERAAGGVRAALSEGDAPRFFRALDTRVGALKLTPGMPACVFDALAPCFDALVVEAFGIGGVPEYEGFARAALAWADAGRTLVVTTQVPEEGLDLGVYEVGRAFAEHPHVLHGGDMTPEALVAKTMWARGQADDPDTMRELFYRAVNHDRAR